MTKRTLHHWTTIQVVFLRSSGEMVLTVSLVQEWLDTESTTTWTVDDNVCWTLIQQKHHLFITFKTNYQIACRMTGENPAVGCSATNSCQSQPTVKTGKNQWSIEKRSENCSTQRWSPRVSLKPRQKLALLCFINFLFPLWFEGQQWISAVIWWKRWDVSLEPLPLWWPLRQQGFPSINHICLA